MNQVVINESQDGKWGRLRSLEVGWGRPGSPVQGWGRFGSLEVDGAGSEKEVVVVVMVVVWGNDGLSARKGAECSNNTAGICPQGWGLTEVRSGVLLSHCLDSLRR
jgi:hypothetical protein